MNKLLNYLKIGALWLWQLPQIVLALLVWAVIGFWSSLGEKFNGKIVIVSKLVTSGFSLGEFIFLNPRYTKEITLKHEYGHCLQSLMLGPLYLLVIGIPSILNFMRSIVKEDSPSYNYYAFYTEKWADKLGGAERS